MLQTSLPTGTLVLAESPERDSAQNENGRRVPVGRLACDIKLADRTPKPGEILLSNTTPDAVRTELKKMGYKLSFGNRTSGPINAIFFDTKHGSLWGGSSNNGEDYGIGW